MEIIAIHLTFPRVDKCSVPVWWCLAVNICPVLTVSTLPNHIQWDTRLNVGRISLLLVIDFYFQPLFELMFGCAALFCPGGLSVCVLHPWLPQPHQAAVHPGDSHGRRISACTGQPYSTPAPHLKKNHHVQNTVWMTQRWIDFKANCRL
jgi:hypothetical protein